MKTEFSDGRVGIRPYRPDDIPLLYEAVQESVNELAMWMPWCHPNYSIDESSAFVLSRDAEWNQGEHYSFVVLEAATGRFLGGVGLNFVNRVHNFANLGYWIRTSYTRRGSATAAVRMAAMFGLRELGFARLEIVVAVGNVASQRVAENAGGRREGVLRKRILLHGQSRDAVMFSLVAEDLNA